MDTDALLSKIIALTQRILLPAGQELALIFEETSQVLSQMDPSIRPLASNGGLGGLIELHRDLPCIIVPDLHARVDLLPALLQTVPPKQSLTTLELLSSNAIQVLMLGDGLHSEGAEAALRWHSAWNEYLMDWSESSAMDQEMTLAFNAMEQVSLLLRAFSEQFFFLKGNHENILNEEGGGNHPFGKFADESRMTLTWTAQFLGESFLKHYSVFEKSLPLVARGRNFLSIHAEPAFALAPSDAIDAYLNPLLIEALTWTANGGAQADAVKLSLAAFLPPKSRPGLIFCGHRVVAERFALRSAGLLVQIHDKERLQAAIVYPDKTFDPKTAIFDLVAN